MEAAGGAPPRSGALKRLLGRNRPTECCKIYRNCAAHERKEFLFLDILDSSLAKVGERQLTLNPAVHAFE